MTWAALVLSVLTFPLLLLSRWSAFASVLLAGVFSTIALRRGARPRVSRIAVGVTAVAATVAGWSLYDTYRPSRGGIDQAPYRRAAQGTRSVPLPLTVRRAPITKLALIPFAPGSDPVYSGIEPQYMLDGPGKNAGGYRVIAYRHDGFVDFYSDLALPFDPEETSEVTGNGLKNNVQTDLSDTIFTVDGQGRAHIAVAFTDVTGRDVRVEIRETTTRRSRPTDLLAPVAMSAVEPVYFPLFVLHDFEFIRTGGTHIDASIDGRAIELEPFPVPLPLQGQFRNFAKYTLDSDLLEVFPVEASMRTVTTEPGTDVFTDGDVTYLFAGQALDRIQVGVTELTFTPPLDIARDGQGRLTIASHPELGAVGAAYHVRTFGGTTEFTMRVDDVTVPRQRDLIYRMIVNERTLFGTWPKGYHYRATIDRATGDIDATWTNDRAG